MAKTTSRKSKAVTVVTFGSPDNADMPSDFDYGELVKRLAQIKNPDDIKAMPSAIAGNKLLRLRAETVVVIEGDHWTFKALKSTRASEDVMEDKFVKRAIEQLDSILTGAIKQGFVLVPYYAKLEKLA